MASTTCIDLMRHGEVQGGTRFRGSTDDPLTDAGWAQMWASVANDRWDYIISSPSTRCAAFAQAFGRRRGIPHRLEPRIAEMHFGAWEGCTTAELMASDAEALRRFWEDPARNAPPGAEPLAAFNARVLSAWRDIVAHHAGKEVLLIAHGGVVRVILGHVLHYPMGRLLEICVPHATLQRVCVEHASSGHDAAVAGEDETP